MTPERWRSIERLYRAALARESGTRAAFLAEACRGDDDLCREVQSLLSYQTRVGDFLEQPAGGELRAALDATDFQGTAPPGRHTGRAFGVYQIEALLAAGGMGEVYRAADRRLNRTVAIKILPQHLSDDADRRQRFQREAKIISSLNHPHICTLYDVGVQDGLDYLVMEYIDGETLQQRLRRGPVPLPRALELSIQMADALDKAHRRGIVHRDLKPANVMLTASGVKLLDFGLAARIAGAGVNGEPSDASATLTRVGTILGTPQYSSPEQLEGKETDPRTDIFSFGVSVYEMLTGQRAFEGETTPRLVAAVLQNEPRPIGDLVPDVPAALTRALSRCMAKEPDERWQTANDLLFELRSIASPAARERAAAPQRRRLPLERIAWTGALSLAILLMFIGPVRRGARETPLLPATPDLRFAIPPAPGTAFYAGYDVPFALSPDGRRLAYVAARSDGARQLWLRDLRTADAEATPLPGTAGAKTPFWAPNSEWIGFFAENALKKLRVSTGVVQEVAGNVSSWAGATWSREDVIVFPRSIRGLSRVSAHGGPVTPLTAGDSSHLWPQFLADGQHFLYAATVARAMIVGSLDGAPPRVLMTLPVRTSSVAYVPGYVFYVQDGTLYARRLDEARLELTGDAVPIVAGIPVNPPGRGPFAVSATGVLAYWPYPAGFPATLRWFDRNGGQSAAVDEPAQYGGFQLSPDGRKLGFSRGDSTGGGNLWVRDLASGTENQLTFDGGAWAPHWSPDGTRLVFSGPRNKPPPKLFVKTIAGTQPDTLVGSSLQPTFPSGWSSDGRVIVSVRIDPLNATDLWIEPVAGGEAVRLPFNTRSNESYGSLSPDDRWLVYTTDQSGKSEVWVASFPAGDVRRQVSVAGGTSPQWGEQGRELFYVSSDKQMIAAPLRAADGQIEVGPGRSLFGVEDIVEVDRLTLPTSSAYSAMRSGERFLVAIRARDPVAPPIHIMVNWRALLDR